jgi:hypothetical protein
MDSEEFRIEDLSAGVLPGTQSVKFSTRGTYRLVDLRISRYVIKQWGIWRVLWGTDVFINGIPIFKLLILANILIWLILFGR